PVPRGKQGESPSLQPLRHTSRQQRDPSPTPNCGPYTSVWRPSPRILFPVNRESDKKTPSTNVTAIHSLHCLCRVRVGDRRLGRIAEADLFPGLLVREQFAQQLVVQLVARLVAVERADQAVTEQVQIADRVQDLVLDELVLVTQAVLVQHAV